MNVLFLTTGRMDDVSEHSLYPDLLREFKKHGHMVYAVSTYERRTQKKTEYKEEIGIHCLRVKVGNITKCGIIEKGISTLLIEKQYKRSIKKYFSQIKFDLILYTTPPITLVNVIKYIKKRDNAKTYLMLKDIFPQNAVDLGMMSKTGIKGLIYFYFRSKEKKLYQVSDRIGCMSPANVEYVKKHNPEVDENKLKLCPNCIEIQDITLTQKEKIQLRDKYGIPQDKTVFVYGGNLGKPQGIDFLIECLRSQKDNLDAYFLIAGNGTEFKKLESFFNCENPTNMKLMERLPKEEYDKMIAACDVGLIFLDYRFTIPNFPSRLLSYMQAGLPVLACTDRNTDIRQFIVEGEFGWWCESKGIAEFSRIINHTTPKNLKEMKGNAKELLKNCTPNIAYENIIGQINDAYIT